MAGPSKKARIEIEFWDEERAQFRTWVAPETPDPAREGYMYPDFIVHALDHERVFHSRVRRDVQCELEFTESCLLGECQENTRLREELQELKDNLVRHEYYLEKSYKEVEELRSEVEKGKKRVRDCKEALQKARAGLESDEESLGPAPPFETPADGQPFVELVLEIVPVADPDPTAGSA